MRFEARHLYFKKLANNLGNFKNIAVSLSSRYQQLQCYVHLNQSTIGEPSLEFGPCSVPDTEFLNQYSVTADATQVKWYIYAYMIFNLHVMYYCKITFVF